MASIPCAAHQAGHYVRKIRRSSFAGPSEISPQPAIPENSDEFIVPGGQSGVVPPNKRLSNSIETNVGFSEATPQSAQALEEPTFGRPPITRRQSMPAMWNSCNVCKSVPSNAWATRSQSHDFGSAVPPETSPDPSTPSESLFTRITKFWATSFVPYVGPRRPSQEREMQADIAESSLVSAVAHLTPYQGDNDRP